MATLDRIEPAYRPWTPASGGMVTEDEAYVGRHRKADSARMFSLRLLFRSARHRAH